MPRWVCFWTSNQRPWSDPANCPKIFFWRFFLGFEHLKYGDVGGRQVSMQSRRSAFVLWKPSNHGPLPASLQSRHSICSIQTSLLLSSSFFSSFSRPDSSLATFAVSQPSRLARSSPLRLASPGLYRLIQRLSSLVSQRSANGHFPSSPCSPWPPWPLWSFPSFSLRSMRTRY